MFLFVAFQLPRSNYCYLDYVNYGPNFGGLSGRTPMLLKVRFVGLKIDTDATDLLSARFLTIGQLGVAGKSGNGGGDGERLRHTRSF